uniref:Membrane protein n=1 Tax=uncultured organism TaxID=155900 RepID=M1Q287_9ZZZZ|nr:membrane protein [uncultured organism]
MERLKDKVSSEKIDEAWKIGTALVLFGILILSSFLFINHDSDETEGDYYHIENTYFVIDRAREFLSGTFIFIGIVLIALSVYNKFSET